MKRPPVVLLSAKSDGEIRGIAFFEARVRIGEDEYVLSGSVLGTDRPFRANLLRAIFPSGRVRTRGVRRDSWKYDAVERALNEPEEAEALVAAIAFGPGVTVSVASTV